MSVGWSLQTGDFLVAGFDGVAVLREGVIVSRPVSSPVEAAFADETGAIVFVPPDPDLVPAGWPDPDRGGGHVLWRVHPDGTLDIMLRTGEEFGPLAGGLTLYQVVVMTQRAATDPIYRVTPILVADGSANYLMITPIGFGAILWAPNDPVGEGTISGVGWQEPVEVAGGRFLVAAHDGGEAWIEARDESGPGLPDESWNPVPRGTPCPDDPSVHSCLDTVTTLPGTQLIAYTETDAGKTMTSLVLFDTDSSVELLRLPVAEGATLVKQLHASDSVIVVNLVRRDGSGFIHLPAIVVDASTGATDTLPVPGMATIVP